MHRHAHTRAALACAVPLLAAAVLCPHAARASEPAATIIDAWAAQPRNEYGVPIDPVSGAPSLRYSQATLADAALTLPSASAAQRGFAEHLLLWLAGQPHSVPPSVFEYAAAADAYLRLPATSPARAPLLAWLQGAPARVWIRDGATTTYNKWMVEAEGALARCRIRELPDWRALCAMGREFVQRTFPRAARRWTTGGVTVISDPPKNPIAYHQLALGYFAHALSRVGTVSVAARRTLVRMARGSVAITAPDGDAAYWGRSQGQSWALVFGAYGLRRARAFTSRAEGARFERAARAMIARYRRVHEGGPLGVAIVPAYRDEPLAPHPGMDAYANVATYAGLTAMALTWLARTTPGRRAPTAARGGPAHGLGNGAFATATARGTWIAVRAHRDAGDGPRYDFGLVAAKRHTASGWVDLVPGRPVRGTAPVGPVLTVDGVTGVPDGESIAVDADGTVVVTGGWRAPDGGWLRRARFTFRPTARGVTITAPVRAGDRIAYGVFARAPQVEAGSVLDGGVRTALSLPGEGQTEPEPYASASDRRLTRVTLTGTAPATGTVVITVA